MRQSVVPSRGARVERTGTYSDSDTGRPRNERRGLMALSLRARSIIFGIIAAAALTGLIAIGSRGFHWFDAALIGYAVATIFATAAVTYKYTFWIARPPTWRYWWRSWQLFFSYENFRHYTPLIPRAIIDLFAQQFIRRRGIYRWVTHQLIFWGVVLSCMITFPLTFGWLRFTQTTTGLYQIWFFGFPLFPFVINSVLGWVIIHALDITALILFFGLVLAFHRRFHDLSVISVQRFGFDIMPLGLLMAIAITGLSLTADSAWLGGEYYWYISLVHEAVVVLWLISLPFGKFFHIIERPATVGIELYWRTGESTEMQRCARCGEEFAPVRFIQDLKKTLHNVGEDYVLREAPVEVEGVHPGNNDEHPVVTQLWWQDLCPTCKRVMRGQANLAALGRGGNRFL
jgi:MFS family permease